MHGAPHPRASETFVVTLPSSSFFGALHRKSTSGGSAYGIPPKNVTGPSCTPVGDVVFPAKAAYPRLTTGPKGEVSVGGLWSAVALPAAQGA